MRVLLSPVWAVTAAVLLASAAAGTDLWKAAEVTYTTSQGLEMHGWLHLPAAASQPGRPLIALLPMMGTAHGAYDLFLDSLAARLRRDTTAATPTVLALDLRGHGASTRLHGKEISYKEMEPGDWAPAPGEVAEFIRRAARDHPEAIDSLNITLVGASIGANAAAIAAPMVPGVRGIALLSPGSDYRGLAPAEALKAFEGRVLICAAREDRYAAESAGRLAKVREGPVLRIFEGGEHGTNLIDRTPEAMSGLLDWLEE
ncbi:MAG TPA: alpha/beta fold hydrolase [candidate division Zixibacteria bacterium]|nr:alpha/beta fold hydrolase [candidate division Zixibacteria bacterium]MDD4917037.1 alpha/beta fold hydrolase [candidate division Zixibacteria bacterium]MDM7972866.1 alpha/beta fold hydrolase [candidate division Zixibacteria bacterium]HOD67467.1 alpha/beta fold hydrolase [candidate division Zixibacteria bacterium]HOZ08235.1 alpha/beta fold hydrolase [candidate division Zixibacteria bacterium]